MLRRLWPWGFAAGACLGIGYLVPEDCAPALVLHSLRLLGLLATFSIIAGSTLAWWGLLALGSPIRASLDHRVRMRVSTLLARRATRFPAGHPAREPWMAWSDDLESLSRRGGSPHLGAGDWGGLLLSAVASFGGGPLLVAALSEAPSGTGTGPAARLADAPNQLVTALLLGLAFVVAALLMGRANRKLYERHLSRTLKGLWGDTRDQKHLTEYPSSLWIDAIGVTGVVLATPALAVLVVAVVEGLSNSS